MVAVSCGTRRRYDFNSWGPKMFKRKLFQVAILLTALAGTETAALAVPSCTKWLVQADGSQWRTCVGDDGRQYCELARNGHVSRVSCK